MSGTVSYLIIVTIVQMTRGGEPKKKALNGDVDIIRQHPRNISSPKTSFTYYSQIVLLDIARSIDRKSQ